MSDNKKQLREAAARRQEKRNLLYEYDESQRKPEKNKVGTAAIVSGPKPQRSQKVLSTEYKKKKALTPEAQRKMNGL